MAKNKILIERLSNDLKTAQAQFTKSAHDLSDLERMIEREHGSITSYASLVTEMRKVGDPYLTNTFVRLAIDKRSSAIAGVEYTVTDLEGNELPDNNPAQQLFNQINKDDSPFDFFFEVNRSLDRFGKAFVVSSEEKRADGKTPQIMYNLPADQVKATTDNHGVLNGWEWKKSDGTVTKFPTEQVLFIKYKHPYNELDGLSPGSSTAKEILQDYYAQLYNIKFFQHGAQGKGVFQPKDGGPALDPKQLDELNYEIDGTFNSGFDGAHRGAVVNRNLEYVQTSTDQKDMEFTTMLNMMRDNILAAYDIPKVIIVSAEATFANLKEAKKIFWNSVLLPIFKKITDTFNTNFFFAAGLPYQLKFKLEEVPELQEDLATKIESASKLALMNIPLSIINEILGLGLPEDGWEGWDRPPASAFAFDTEVPDLKSVAEELNKQKLIEDENKIQNDEFYKQMEYQKSLSVMLYYEKIFTREVKDFYKEKFKEIEDYIKSDAITAVTSKAADDLVDPDWISKFSKWLTAREWGQSFLDKMSPIIETVFNRGVFRTFSGIGADIKPGTERTIQHIINRGLKLKDSPQIVQDIIVNMLGTEEWTVDKMANAISKQWDQASIARAKNISITETASAFNGGRVEGMKQLGIKHKQWIHSHDAKVRSSHRIDSIIPVNEQFTLSDGYRVSYPGDGNPEHACNCRCVITSVLGLPGGLSST